MILATVRPDKPTWLTMTRDGRFYGTAWTDTAAETLALAQHINETQNVPTGWQIITIDAAPIAPTTPRPWPQV